MSGRGHDDLVVRILHRRILQGRGIRRDFGREWQECQLGSEGGLEPEERRLSQIQLAVGGLLSHLSQRHCAQTHLGFRA